MYTGSTPLYLNGFNNIFVITTFLCVKIHSFLLFLYDIINCNKDIDHKLLGIYEW